MPKAKKTRKFAAVKRMISPKDVRLAHKAAAAPNSQPSSEKKKKTFDGDVVRNLPKTSTALFFKHNTALGPPYQILVDTNFINFSITNKLDVFKSFMDLLLAKCIPILTSCVLAELEKLGPKYRVALRIAKDPRFQRLECTHKGIYADDCLVSRVTNHKCYMVATCDKDLKRRIRKIPGVPIVYITQHKYSIERFADVNDAPRQG